MNLDELRDKLAEKNARKYDTTDVYKNANLPPALIFTMDDFKAGFDAAIKLCQDMAGELDTSADCVLVEARWPDAHYSAADYFSRGRVHQHEQMSAALGALRADCAYRDEVIITHERSLFNREREIAKLKEENERLEKELTERKAFLKFLEQSDNLLGNKIRTHETTIADQRELLEELAKALAFLPDLIAVIEGDPDIGDFQQYTNEYYELEAVAKRALCAIDLTAKLVGE
jgi:hypothetical protein